MLLVMTPLPTPLITPPLTSRYFMSFLESPQTGDALVLEVIVSSTYKNTIQVTQFVDIGDDLIYLGSFNTRNQVTYR